MGPKISVIVPFFNEEQNVASLLAEIRVVCHGLGKPYEGIFVNDGSTDAAGRRLDEVAKGGQKRRRSTSNRITVRLLRFALA